MIIRKARKSDISDCARMSMIPEFERGDEYPDEEFLLRLLKGGLFFVAEEEGKVVGYIGAFILTSKEVYLDLLTVDENFRGNGIGRKLLTFLKKDMKAKGIKEFFLIASSSNKNTLKFYEANKLNRKKDPQILFSGRL